MQAGHVVNKHASTRGMARGGVRQCRWTTSGWPRVLKAFGFKWFQILQSTYLHTFQSHWFQIDSTCTPTAGAATAEQAAAAAAKIVASASGGGAAAERESAALTALVTAGLRNRLCLVDTGQPQYYSVPVPAMYTMPLYVTGTLYTFSYTVSTNHK